MSLLSDKQIAGLRYMTCLLLKNPLGQVNLYVIQSYCVKFACDYDEARDKTDNFSSQTLWELMCFKRFQLSYGTSVHENNYDTSRILRSVIFPALSLPS